MSRVIDYRPVADLPGDPRNPKGHAAGTINDSVTRFGFVEPIVVDGRTGMIVSGHGRRDALAAMEARGDSPPDGIRLDDGGRWLVPVVTGWASKDDTEAAGALIALNRATELGGWVDESLLDLLSQLSGVGDLTGIGFDQSDLDDLRAQLETPAASGAKGAWESPSLDDYAARYEEQGRRMIVLDYTRDEYARVTRGLAALRDQLSTETNSAAILSFLTDRFGDQLDQRDGDGE